MFTRAALAMIALAGAVAVVNSTAKGDGPADCLLFDDFSGDLSQWNNWNGGGIHTIAITGSDGVPPPALLIDDHLNWGAAVFSKQTFTYSDGLVISADQKSDAAWLSQRYTVTGLWRGGPATSVTRGLAALSINDNGDTIDCSLVYDDCGTEEVEFYRHDYPNTGQWLHGRIDIRPNGFVEFYVGPDSVTDPDLSELQLIYTSVHPVTMAYDGVATVKFGNRRNLFDNVCVGLPTAPPDNLAPLFAASSWQLDGTLPTPIASHGVAVINGQIIVFSGYDGSTVVSDVYLYQPGGGWDATPAEYRCLPWVSSGCRS